MSSQPQYDTLIFLRPTQGDSRCEGREEALETVFLKGHCVNKHAPIFGVNWKLINVFDSILDKNHKDV